MKLNNLSIRLIIFFTISAWCATFFAAASDCSVQDWIKLNCTQIGFSKIPIDDKSTKGINYQGIKTNIDKNTLFISVEQPKDPPDASTLKGQFGDFFGVLNALFGALTLITVYGAYKLELKSTQDTQRATAEQLRTLRHERYLSDVDSAIQSYNRLLQLIDIPIPNSTNITAVHGLVHLWNAYLTFGGAFGGRTTNKYSYPTTYRHPIDKNDTNSFVNLWVPLLEQQGKLSNISEDGWNSENWINDQILNLSPPDVEDFANRLGINWRRLYSENRYQLDALFRAWYYVYKTINAANEFNIDIKTHWLVAARFRAQLSAIELQFLLCNQVFAEFPGFPQATAMSQTYAIFNNYAPGVDPCAHLVYMIAKGDITISNYQSLSPSCFESLIAKYNLQNSA